MPADLVVLPRTTAEVSRVLRIAREHRVPVTPCGARSGKSGGSMPVQGGVVLSVERMNTIQSISTEDLVAVVEPGVVTGDLMKAVEAKGLFYPPDPNSWEWCTLGGNVAENAGGPRALKYGVTRDYVLGLEWVMPDGEVLRVGRRTIKGVAGYDLVGLLVGSEGTLGVATEITLQLHPAAPRGEDRAAGLRRRPGCRPGGERDPRRGRASPDAGADGRPGGQGRGRQGLQLPARHRRLRPGRGGRQRARGGLRRAGPARGDRRGTTAPARPGSPRTRASGRSSGRRGGR